MFCFASNNFSFGNIVAAMSATTFLVYSVVVLKPAIENDLSPREENDLRWVSQLRGGGGDDTDTLKLLAETENIWLRPNLEHRDVSLLMEEYEDYMRSDVQIHNKEQFSVCGRKTNTGTSKDLTLLQDSIYQDGTCPEVNTNDLLLISGERGTFGRTGNNIIEFLHSLQFARDKNVNLGIMYDSWVFSVILELWMSVHGDDWQQQFEEAFCVKIFHSGSELVGYNVLFPDLDVKDFTKEMFMYSTESPFAEYIGQQAEHLQTLFRHYDKGEGKTTRGKPVQNMCAGLDAVFGKHTYGLDNILGKTYKDTIYTAIHSRKLEGAPGVRMMNKMSQRTGCDPTGALDLRPDYIKSILGPLGMLEYPIVFISDGQDPSVLERLQADPEISQQLRVVPDEASWLGGDITIAVMSNVFIGNPVSSFSGIIAKSRLALGFAHNYLWRAKDDVGNWHTVCGDTCIFDKSFMGALA